MRCFTLIATALLVLGMTLIVFFFMTPRKARQHF